MSAEPQGLDPYEAVLTDLRAKRDQIDQAIAAIEGLRGGVASSTPSNASQSQNSTLDGPSPFLGMTIPEAAKKLLATRRQPLRNPDIWAAFRAGGLVLQSKEPANTIGSVLTRRFLEVGDIVRVGRGVWGLKEWYPGRSFKKEAKSDNESKEGDETKVATSVTEQPSERRLRARLD
jgi:HB1, ASXL, restriction endonuclease HTH domain